MSLILIFHLKTTRHRVALLISNLFKKTLCGRVMRRVWSDLLFPAYLFYLITLSFESWKVFRALEAVLCKEYTCPIICPRILKASFCCETKWRSTPAFQTKENSLCGENSRDSWNPLSPLELNPGLGVKHGALPIHLWIWEDRLSLPFSLEKPEERPSL